MFPVAVVFGPLVGALGIPLTSSIADGRALGLVACPAVKLLAGRAGARWGGSCSYDTNPVEKRESAPGEVC